LDLTAPDESSRCTSQVVVISLLWFAAWEEPELFATEIRAAFNSLRYRA
jgi:hypothetical protein